MSQPETRFKLKVQRILDTIPDLYHEKIQQVAKRGTPDILICFRGWYIAWELKITGNTATKLQEYKLHLIDKAGGIARVVTPGNLEESIKELLCLPCLKSQRELLEKNQSLHPPFQRLLKYQSLENQPVKRLPKP